MTLLHPDETSTPLLAPADMQLDRARQIRVGSRTVTAAALAILIAAIIIAYLGSLE